MKEDIEARANELDPTKSKTIGSYVIGTPKNTKARLLVRVPSGRSSRPYTCQLVRKWQSKFSKRRR